MDPEIDVEEARTPIKPRQLTSYGATEPLADQKKEKKEIDKKSGPGSHTWMYSMLRYHSHHWYSLAYRSVLRALVWLSVWNYICQDCEYFEKHYMTYFVVFEAVTSCLFLAEYVLKIWTAPERKCFKYEQPDRARLMWIMSSESIIDVICWLPFFIELSSGISPFSLVILRLLRLVRFGKLHEFWGSFRLVARVLYYNNHILVQAFLVCFVMLLACSIALYYTRPAHDPDDNFSSILACAYLAILMLTGQGIPNGTMPWDTRIVVSVTAIFAIAQFAIPASMLTWGFENEAERNIGLKYEKEKKAAQQQLEGTDAPCSSSSSDETDRQEEWDGYLEQLLGSDEESGSEDEKKDNSALKELASSPAARGQLILSMNKTSATSLAPQEMQRAKRIFIKLDTNDTGILEITQIRAITESEAHAKDLMQQIASSCCVSGEDKVTLREFLVWLGDVKTNYTQHGEGQTLNRLLEDMETRLAKKYATAKARWKKAGASILSQVHANKAVETTVDHLSSAVAKPMSKQLMELAQNLGEIENMNSLLKQKVSMMEKEIAEAKAAKMAVGG